MTDTATAPEVHRLPNGEMVVYRDSDHSYWKALNKNGSCSGRLTANTTVVKAMDVGNNDGLLNWAAGLTCEGIAALCSVELDDEHPAPAWLFSADGIRTALEEAELTWKDIRNAAGTRGTNVHKHALEALASGAVLPSYAEMTEAERGYCNGVTGWWLEAEPKVIASEFVVADLELGVAGRCDLLYRATRGERKGQLGIADLKTGRFRSGKEVAQIAGYGHMAVASGYPQAEFGVIIDVSEDGSFAAYDFDLDPSDFLIALECYRCAGRLGKLVRS